MLTACDRSPDADSAWSRMDGAKILAPEELDPTHAIVLVCHGGLMGDELAEMLEARGFSTVRNLAGGMHRWSGPTEPSK